MEDWFDALARSSLACSPQVEPSSSKRRAQARRASKDQPQIYGRYWTRTSRPPECKSGALTNCANRPKYNLHHRRIKLQLKLPVTKMSFKAGPPLAEANRPKPNLLLKLPATKNSIQAGPPPADANRPMPLFIPVTLRKTCPGQ